MKLHQILIIPIFLLMVFSCRKESTDNAADENIVIDDGSDQDAIPDVIQPANQNITLHAQNYDGTILNILNSGAIDIDFYAQNADQLSDITYNMTNLPQGAEFRIDGNTPSLYWLEPTQGDHQVILNARSAQTGNVVASETFTISINQQSDNSFDRIIALIRISDALTGRTLAPEIETLLGSGAGNGLNLSQLFGDLSSNNLNPTDLLSILTNRQNNGQ